MAGTTRFEELYDFLVHREQTGEPFSLGELADATDYAESSVRTYLTKYLVGYIVWEDGDDTYLSDGISREYTKAEFLEYMSQTSRYVKMDETDRLVESLVDRSSDAFLLALESYNRPSLQNRVEAFCILMVNAWELLLKGQLARRDGREALYRSDNSGYTISIGTAVERIFPDDHHPIRENIESLVELRNDAVHLLLPDLQARLGELFQAAVINFRNHFEGFTGRQLLDLTPGLMTLAVDGGQVRPAVIERKYGVDTAARARAFLQRLNRRQSRHQGENEFAVSIERRLVLAEEPGEGDIELTEGNGGTDAVHIVEPRDIDETHPYRVTEVVDAINEQLGDDVPREINNYDILSVDHARAIRNGHHPEFYYRLERPKTHRYSDQYVEWFVDNLTEDWEWLEAARQAYSAYRRSLREREDAQS